MNKLLISIGPDQQNMRYRCGFSAPDPVVFLQTKQGGKLVVPDLEYGRAVRLCSGTEVFTPQQLGLERGRSGLEQWCLLLLEREQIRSVSVSRFFPYAAAKILMDSGIDVNLTKGELFPERAVKSDEEVACIEETQKSVAAAIREAIRLIGSSEVTAQHTLKLDGKLLTSERVREAIERVLRSRNCQAQETIVAGGVQGADPHEMGSGALPSDFPIILDVFPRSVLHGYYGDMTRTVIREKPSPTLKKMYRAVRKAQQTALDQIRPGVAGKTVHAAVSRTLESEGFETSSDGPVPMGFFHGTGHGVGLDIHEAPSLSTRPGRLRVGHVITVEPGLYYPELGGIRIEDTVVVTREGCRILAPCRKTFQVGS